MSAEATKQALVLLQACTLSAGWPQKTVLREIDLTLAGGQITVIAGPNGAGKSTLLRTMARQLRPLSGKVTLAGRDLAEMSESEVAKNISFVPQTLELNRDLTVEELVTLGRNPHQRWWSWTVSEGDREAVHEALELTALSNFRKQYLSNLSGGEQQRAAIAMALAQKARFMLLDEPTSHLDFRHQLELVSLLRALRDEQLGILVVLHDLNLIAKVADQVVLLHRNGGAPGTILAAGEAAAVLSPGRLEQAYKVDVTVLANPITGEPVYSLDRLST